MDALRSDPDASVEHLSGGEAPRRALPALAEQARPLAPRRAHQPPRRGDRRLVERHLRSTGCVIAVTHDRYFLDNVAEWILELDHGSAIPFQGNYSGWLEQKTERLRKEEKAESKRQRTLKQELEWIRSSPKARQAKQKARITGYEELVAQAKDARRATGAKIRIPMTKRLGDVVVAAEGLTKGFGEKLLIDNFEFNLPRGGIVGIIGANGAGKTTLKMITDSSSPTPAISALARRSTWPTWTSARRPGRHQVGLGRDLGWTRHRQHRWPRDELARLRLGLQLHRTDQQQKVGTLSGGERNRVHLAKLLKSGGNLMLLDEPTNDLAVETSATSKRRS